MIELKIANEITKVSICSLYSLHTFIGRKNKSNEKEVVKKFLIFYNQLVDKLKDLYKQFKVMIMNY